MRKGARNPFYGRHHTRATKKKMAMVTRRFNLNRTYDICPISIRIPQRRDYFVALIDGEGSIRFRFHRGNKHPFVAIYNGNRKLRAWLFRNTGRMPAWTDRRGRVAGWTWNVSAAADVYLICSQLLTDFVVKQADAARALKFLLKKYGEYKLELAVSRGS